MFTGLVEELGRVTAIDVDGDAARLAIACREVVADAEVGDSIAVDGCCLTATTVDASGFTCDLMAATLEATALGDLVVGATVNLERAMRADGRFGGHLVQGHVDGVGTVVGRDEQPGTVWLEVRVPAALLPYLVPKGSITVAGTSLTVVDLDDDVVRIGLIPHTVEVTTVGRLTPGDRVNLEVDVIAKYVERLVAAGAASPYLDAAGAPAGPAPTTPQERP